MDEEDLKRRLQAHREILITIVVSLAQAGHGDIVDNLLPETVFMDGEEDPGVVPSAEFAVEQARADEIREIVDAVRLRIKRS
jgi:hypothetical protein